MEKTKKTEVKKESEKTKKVDSTKKNETKKVSESKPKKKKDETKSNSVAINPDNVDVDVVVRDPKVIAMDSLDKLTGLRRDFEKKYGVTFKSYNSTKCDGVYNGTGSWVNLTLGDIIYCFVNGVSKERFDEWVSYNLMMKSDGYKPIYLFEYLNGERIKERTGICKFIYWLKNLFK